MIYSTRATIIIGVLLFAGIYRSLCPEYTYEPSWYRNQQAVIFEQMDVLADGLRTHAKRTGAYPTNAQGLGAVSGDIPANRLFDMGAMSTSLRLLPVWHYLNGSSGAHGYQQSPVVVSGMLAYTPWYVPYVYENRRGLPDDAFADSPATAAHADYHALQVDDGIFIYASELIALGAEYRALMWEMWGVRGATFVLFLLFVFVVRLSPAQDGSCDRFRNILAKAGMFVMMLLGCMSIGVTCYMMSFFSIYKRPELLAKHRELLAEYVRRGVIAPDVAETIRKTTERDTPAIADRYKQGG